MKLLLHICCGPCATASISFWRERGTEVEGFFYNPNIHPLMEYRRRLTGARDVAEIHQVPLVIDEHYDPMEWFKNVSRKGKSRCFWCIRERLFRTAREARERGADAFSTTLSISPHQDHDAIKEAGTEASQVYEIPFLYEDLRSLYYESRRLSREWGVYRQKYCGCVVSEWERYRES